MASAKPMTKEVIALTEKKMDMTLDDIIKMSKTGGPKTKKSRLPNKSQRNFSNVAQQKTTRFKQYMNSRSSIRQGVLARRRSNFQGSQFPLTHEAAKRASARPFRNLIRDRRGNPNRGRNGAAFSNVKRSTEGYSAKWEHQQQQKQEPSMRPNQKPQTLDVLFASLKEQRWNAAPRRNGPSMRNGPDKQIPPWSRGRFGK